VSKFIKEAGIAVYKPKVIEGKINGTGWPIDGHSLMLSSWNYDNHDSWHLDYWKDEDDILANRKIDKVFSPEMSAEQRKRLHDGWRNCVKALMVWSEGEKEFTK